MGTICFIIKQMVFIYIYCCILVWLSILEMPNEYKNKQKSDYCSDNKEQGNAERGTCTVLPTTACTTAAGTTAANTLSPSTSTTGMAARKTGTISCF